MKLPSGLQFEKNVNRMEWHPIVILFYKWQSDDTQGHFNMDTLGINFFYGGVGRRYGDRERIRLLLVR